jgi:hypothetical protein
MPWFRVVAVCEHETYVDAPNAEEAQRDLCDQTFKDLGCKHNEVELATPGQIEYEKLGVSEYPPKLSTTGEYNCALCGDEINKTLQAYTNNMVENKYYHYKCWQKKCAPWRFDDTKAGQDG